MPLNLKQLSMRCDIKIEDINVNISNIVHFKQNKLKALLIDDILLHWDNMEKMTVLINMEIVAKHECKEN